MSEPIDEQQLLSDVNEYRHRLGGARDDAEDLEKDAGRWPGATGIESLAGDARSALEALSEALSGYLRGSDG